MIDLIHSLLSDFANLSIYDIILLGFFQLLVVFIFAIINGGSNDD